MTLTTPLLRNCNIGPARRSQGQGWAYRHGTGLALAANLGVWIALGAAVYLAV